jgi:hypothetical protein
MALCGLTYVVFVIGGIQVDAVLAGGEEDFGSEAETWLRMQTWELRGGCFLEAHVSDGSLSIICCIVSAMRCP